MPRLSLGLGVQTIRKVGGGAAPSGIPVATTSDILVVDTSGYGWDGSYEKESSTLYRNSANQDQVILWNGSEWSLYDEDFTEQVFPVPPSTNINYIADTGWPAQTLAPN